MKNLSEREANLRGYLLERLHSLRNMQRNHVYYLPIEKVKLMAKINIITHLVDYNGYRHFVDKEQLDKYIEQNINIICGFYED